MSVTYTNYNGRIVAENRGGTETLFLPDTLGNVIETRDMNTGAKTSETTYWPYGEIRTQTGTNPSPFGFCGIWGYYSSPNLPTYVRARYYRPAQGRWQTVDPLWPTEPGYEYADNLAIQKHDYFGMNALPVSFGCGNPTNEYIYKLCNRCGQNILCQLECDRLAYEYYRRCKGIPGPGRFAPPIGGGIVAPRRNLPSRCRNQVYILPTIPPAQIPPPGGHFDAKPTQPVNTGVLTGVRLLPGQHTRRGDECWKLAVESLERTFPGSNPEAEMPLAVQGGCMDCCRNSIHVDECLNSCRTYTMVALSIFINRFRR
jgi:RHS repeat-associated protein